MDENLELKIYKNYRAVMSKRNKSNGYPAYYRQLARKACVNRYNVSYQEVKRIVAKFDAVYGITHEKQPAQHNLPNNLQNHIPHPQEFLDDKGQLRQKG